MKLNKLFNNYKGLNIDIKGIKTNSKEVNKGDIFVCVKGVNADRHEYIYDAITNGASFLVVSQDVSSTIPYIKVENTNNELIRLLKIFYNNPQDKLKLIGITGTDGKTTSAKIIQKLIGNDTCGYIGTLGADCRYFKEQTGNTTPSIEKLFYLLNKFVLNNIKYVVVETSSEAFYYHRLDGITFDIGCLTNITSEHLNTHKTIENYIKCKKELFINSKLQILNSNDIHFNEIKNISNNYYTYGYNYDDTLSINKYTLYPNRTSITLTYDNNKLSFESSLICKFNVENLALAVMVLISLGFDINTIITKTNDLQIPGRMQAINQGQNFYCLIDYAHTTNSIKSVLEFAKSLDVNRIITVTGQAGGRDPYKRKDIGRIVLELSDYAFFTADDPRYEKVEDIINMMLSDTNKINYKIVVDRSKAIEEAVNYAKENDLILFLGKGVDPYQKVEDYEIPYREEDEVIKAINKKYQE